MGSVPSVKTTEPQMYIIYNRISAANLRYLFKEKKDTMVNHYQKKVLSTKKSTNFYEKSKRLNPIIRKSFRGSFI